LPSKFAHYNEPAEAVFDKAILPIAKLPLVINGFKCRAENYMAERRSSSTIYLLP